MKITTGLYSCAIGLLLMGGKVSAEVEFPVWERHYTGTVAGKAVEMDLQSINGGLSGRYCYAPCNYKKGTLSLSGASADNALTLEEKASGTVTGSWALTDENGTLKGTWFSPDRKRHYPAELRPVKSPDTPAIDFALVADRLPEHTTNCDSPPTISAIRLYQNGKRLQELPTESTGTCNIFLPEWRDVNFDGHADLMIAQFLPAGPNIPYQTWLYDPGQKMFVDAPASFQEITSPDLDPEHQQITSFWRSSCCHHGVDVYRWQGKEVVQIDRGESYQQPVIDKGRYLACYVIPDYQDGRIVYPIQRHNGRLRRLEVEEDACETSISTERLQTVIQSDKGLEVMPVKWVKHADGYCPEVPFLDGNKISKIMVTNEKVENICLNEEEYRQMFTSSQP